MIFRFVRALVVLSVLSTDARAQEPPSSPPPLQVPLNMTETAAQTYKASLQVGIGSQWLQIGIDTGSVGLVLFATPGIRGSGARCSGPGTGPISVEYGNPHRVTYGGHTCIGAISLAGVISTPPIPFALLTSTTWCAPDLQCGTPQQNYAKGDYGIFGVGIGPGTLLPNPLRTLTGAYGKRFMLRLNSTDGASSFLILAPPWRFDAAIFPQSDQTVGALNLPGYDKGQGCLLYIEDEKQTSVCPLVSFDTGNGVPWLHVDVLGLNTVPGPNGITYVAPGMTLGFAPRPGAPAAFSLVTSDSFAGEFRYESVGNLINVGMQAFLGNDVTYDAEQGVITVAPTLPEQAP